MNTYLIHWRYFHKKPKGATTTGQNTIEAKSETAAKKEYRKRFGHHEIISISLLDGKEYNALATD